jgi:uncharacterized HAD superfamily protein
VSFSVRRNAIRKPLFSNQCIRTSTQIVALSAFKGWEEQVKQQLMKDLIIADAICISIDAWKPTAQSQYISVLAMMLSRA